MKQLSESRTKLVFEKLSKYIGSNVKLLIDRPDGTYCFRERKERVYYVSERILHLAETVAPEHLVCAGTCFGKFTKAGRFHLHVTALSYLAPYAQYKIWLKPSAEQQFLYGHNVLKSGLGRITENTPRYQGVVVLSMSDLPLQRTERAKEPGGNAVVSSATCWTAVPSTKLPAHSRFRHGSAVDGRVQAR